ncbi:MAG: hypothetical protein EZS28_017543 [Streblomastix strix]|uniref:Uncharacterized protein n=1 Tax=Streblomastix strix TaxID=222440 RepID=A0A5J4VWD0_9EUKA|nr:MAG: hypothetical protein EZS28_017543 [Streblomastix strix]
MSGQNKRLERAGEYSPQFFRQNRISPERKSPEQRTINAITLTPEQRVNQSAVLIENSLVAHQLISAQQQQQKLILQQQEQLKILQDKQEELLRQQQQILNLQSPVRSSIRSSPHLDRLNQSQTDKFHNNDHIVYPQSQIQPRPISPPRQDPLMKRTSNAGSIQQDLPEFQYGAELSQKLDQSWKSGNKGDKSPDIERLSGNLQNTVQLSPSDSTDYSSDSSDEYYNENNHSKSNTHLNNNEHRHSRRHKHDHKHRYDHSLSHSHISTSHHSSDTHMNIHYTEYEQSLIQDRIERINKQDHIRQREKERTRIERDIKWDEEDRRIQRDREARNELLRQREDEFNQLVERQKIKDQEVLLEKLKERENERQKEIEQMRYERQLKEAESIRERELNERLLEIKRRKATNSYNLMNQHLKSPVQQTKILPPTASVELESVLPLLYNPKTIALSATRSASPIAPFSTSMVSSPVKQQSVNVNYTQSSSALYNQSPSRTSDNQSSQRVDTIYNPTISKLPPESTDMPNAPYSTVLINFSLKSQSTNMNNSSNSKQRQSPTKDQQQQSIQQSSNTDNYTSQLPKTTSPSRKRRTSPPLSAQSSFFSKQQPIEGNTNNNNSAVTLPMTYDESGNDSGLLQGRRRKSPGIQITIGSGNQYE